MLQSNEGVWQRRVLRAMLGDWALGALIAGPATGQSSSPTWLPTYGSYPGVVGVVNAAEVFDDGTGPALYLGGTFTQAGGVQAFHLARWDGGDWSPVMDAFKNGVGSTVEAMCVFDDGTGPALYVAGSFQTAGNQPSRRIAKWNGTAWTSLGSGIQNGAVKALAVFDDGTGPAVFAGGSFTSAGGIAASRIAKWDGDAWSELAGGIGTGLEVAALAAFDDGSGPALYVGGQFTHAGGLSVDNLARWDGASWTAVGAGLGGGSSTRVDAFLHFDDGSGPTLYACGDFIATGGQFISDVARWDGTGWTSPASLYGEARTLIAYDAGAGEMLYAGGNFGSSGSVVRLEGGLWQPVGGGVDQEVRAFGIFDSGGGPVLYAGGDFRRAGGLGTPAVASWDGSAWSALGEGLDQSVSDLVAFDDGSGEALYAGGFFTSADGTILNGVARWEEPGWSPLGSGPGALVWALAVFDDGSGPTLYSGGSFSTFTGYAADRVARWDGAAWVPLGSGLRGAGAGSVYALVSFDDGGGSQLYAGGDFSQAGGGSAERIAAWDGAEWSALSTGMDARVRALEVFDDGSGEALFAGGDFNTAGGVVVNQVARWDGASWSALGSGLGGPVYAFAVHDDGTGPALYAGGQFVLNGVRGLARWDGSAWSTVAGGVNSSSTIYSLTSADDGVGRALFAGGQLSQIGGAFVSGVGRWDGTQWSALGSGVGANHIVYALLPSVGIGRPAVEVGGTFRQVAGDAYLARWGSPDASALTTYCTAGVSFFGCRALLTSNGTPSASVGGGFDLIAAGVEGGADGLYFYGANGRQAQPWGNGTSFQCVRPPVTRAGLHSGVGSPTKCDGVFSQDLNALWSEQPAKNPGAGSTVQT